jgi:hypothetical protein
LFRTTIIGNNPHREKISFNFLDFRAKLSGVEGQPPAHLDDLADYTVPNDQPFYFSSLVIHLPFSNLVHLHFCQQVHRDKEKKLRRNHLSLLKKKFF